MPGRLSSNCKEETMKSILTFIARAIVEAGANSLVCEVGKLIQRAVKRN